MTDTIQTRGGWGVSYDRMSPALRARCAADDRQYDRALRAQQERRDAVASGAEQSRIRAAIELAEQQGQVVNPAEVWRTGGASIGRTRSEALAYFSAVQDVEDARVRKQQEEAQAEAQRYHAALQEVHDPRTGRTKAEALRYFSAVQDLEEVRRPRPVTASTDARYDTGWLREAKERHQARRGLAA